MKLLLLGDAGSIHLQRWANGLAQAGVEIVCATQHEPLPDGWYRGVVRRRLPAVGAAGYLLNVPALRRLMRDSGAALLHAHYASGYGLLATVSGCRPRLVSAWGSDIYEFADRSALHRALLRQVLGSADAVACTSRAMAARIAALSAGTIVPTVTPFGIDTDCFTPDGPAAVPRGVGGLCIGTVKGLARTYGIDLLLRAFAALRQHAAAGPALRLRIVGDGPQRDELRALAHELGLGASVVFAGAVANADVAAELRAMDIFVAASRQEGFGVAVVEAAACGLPVVASRVGGLPEVVDDGITGLLVPAEDVAALTAALAHLVGDAAYRQRCGLAGREMALRRYGLAACVRVMLALYARVLAGAAA